MTLQIVNERESVKVLRECIELQNKKSQDYQAEESSVKQADYYPNGVSTIHDIMHAKMLRMKSLQDKMKSGKEPNFESLADSAKDLINYASFYVAWLRNGIDGQDPKKDIFNKEKPGIVASTSNTFLTGTVHVISSDSVSR